MLDSTERLFVIVEAQCRRGPVVYWMSRDQRVRDNWALTYAIQKAGEHDVPVMVIFCLTDDFLGASYRHYHFMLQGLKEVESDLHEKGIPFYLLVGKPVERIRTFLIDNDAMLLITDFDPTRVKTTWLQSIASQQNRPIHQVDAHNIVPCRLAYPGRAAFSAGVIRKSIVTRLPVFCGEFPVLETQKKQITFPVNDWQGALELAAEIEGPATVNWLTPGYSAGIKVLAEFVDMRLDRYAEWSNDPSKDFQSHLSPYLHFGQIAAQRVALVVQRSHSPDAAAFLEQLIVRRELADNWCLNNPDYDSFNGFPQWARHSLDRHRHDIRSYIYSQKQFENAETHDPLWNAAQREMLLCGKMHGYMRMYWAKKILEWSEDPETALDTAIYLNDRYSLDGRDPNGYAGIAWSIGGVHDRPWSERPVFGQIRYMNDRGAKRKFDVASYIERVERLGDIDKR